jgi:hypothetical protein
MIQLSPNTQLYHSNVKIVQLLDQKKATLDREEKFLKKTGVRKFFENSLYAKKRSICKKTEQNDKIEEFRTGLFRFHLDFGSSIRNKECCVLRKKFQSYKKKETFRKLYAKMRSIRRKCPIGSTINMIKYFKLKNSRSQRHWIWIKTVFYEWWRARKFVTTFCEA